MCDLVSIIVPIYNIHKYISSCIDSIINQTYKNIEIILVDDGSTDASGALCDKYAQEYVFIKVIHKENAGLGFARNTGIENAKGDYIAFVDGDDYISRDYVEQFLKKMKSKNLDVCYGGHYQQVGDSFIPIINPLEGKYFKNDKILKQFFPYLCGKLDYKTQDEVQMSVCMALYSLKLIKNNNIRFHSERDLISEDLIFNLDFLEKATKIGVSSNCGYYYRYTEGSLTKTYRSDRLEKQTYFTKYVIDRTKELGIYNECEQRINSTYLAWVRAIIQGEQKKYKSIGIKKSLNNISTICSDNFVITIIKKYDDSNLTLKLWIMNTFIKNKLVILLWLLSYLKGKI